MAKKNFDEVTGSRVLGEIEKSTGKKRQQTTASPEEQAERAAQLRTQGRKGCKPARYNIAFTPENYKFIKILASASGKTLAQCCNDIFSKYREQNPEIEKRAKAFIKFMEEQQ